MDLFGNQSPAQDSLAFPTALTERYRPKTVDAFIGLDKPKRIAAKLASKPFESAWLFVGASGTGKTTLALALAEMIPAELHHVPSQNCNLEEISRIRKTCQYVPAAGKRFHLVLVDEADQMSIAAQNALLSHLDSTNFPPNTIYIFTCNGTDRLEQRFISRTRMVEFSSYGMSKDAAQLLETVWASEAPAGAPAPNFARIVKDSNNNIREALMSLETELMLI